MKENWKVTEIKDEKKVLVYGIIRKWRHDNRGEGVGDFVTQVQKGLVAWQRVLKISNFRDVV